MVNGIIPTNSGTNLGNGKVILPKINDNLTLNSYGSNGGALFAFTPCDQGLVYDTNTGIGTFENINTNGTKTSLPKTIIESQEWADSLNNISGFYEGPNGAERGTRFVEGRNFYDQNREVPPIKIPKDYNSPTKYAVDMLPTSDEIQQNINTNGTRTDLFSQDVILGDSSPTVSDWREQRLRAGDVTLNSPISSSSDWRGVTLKSGEQVTSINRPPEDLPGNSNGKVKLKSGEEVISINLDFNNLLTPVHNINVTPIPKDVII